MNALARSLLLLLVVAPACGPARVAPEPVRIVAQAEPPPPLPPLGPDSRTMRVHFVDVGQGDATLLETPCGVVLVDAGGEHSRHVKGAKALSIYLDRFFEDRPWLDRTIELFVLTHPHIDHVRGAPEVLERFRVRRLLDNGQPGEEPADRAVRAVNRAVRRSQGTDAAVERRAVLLADVPADGLTDALVDPLQCEAVDPQIRLFWGQLGSSAGWGEGWLNANNHSVAMRLDWGAASLLLTGDLEDEAIDALVSRSGAALDVDIYQAGHHGSHNGTTTGLLEAMTPRMSVISMGHSDHGGAFTAKAHGHPRRVLVERLAGGVSCARSPVTVSVARGARSFEPMDVAAAVYATGWEGTVVVEMDADGGVQVVRPVGEPACAQ